MTNYEQNGNLLQLYDKNDNQIKQIYINKKYIEQLCILNNLTNVYENMESIIYCQQLGMHKFYMYNTINNDYYSISMSTFEKD